MFGSGGDDFFGGGGGDDFFGGGMGGPMGGMGGPMGGGLGGMGGPMGGMGGGNPRQGGYSSFSSYDSARPEGQPYQERHEPFGDYAGGGGGGNEPTPRRRGGAGCMFSGATRADNPFRRQVGRNPAGGYNPSGPAQEEPSHQHVSFDNRDGGANQRRFMDEYQRTGRVNPQYATEYEEYPRSAPRGQGGGRSGRLFDFGNLGSSRRQPSGQQAYYGDDSDSEDEGARPRQSYAPQQAYGGGGGGARRSGGSGGGRLFNYDRFGRRG